MTSPITPPPELVQQWQDESPETQIADHIQYLVTRAAQWGSDQELRACCEHVRKDVTEFSSYAHLCAQRKSDELYAARRPKPPSLKEQALEQLREVNAILQFQTTGGETSAIRRALEALPND